MHNESSAPEQRMGSRVSVCVDVTGCDDMVLQNRCVFRIGSERFQKFGILKGRKAQYFEALNRKR